MSDRKRQRTGDGTDGGEHWVVCVDGGDVANVAFEWTLEHIKKQRDRVTVVYCAETVQTSFAQPSAFYQQLRDQLNAEGVKHGDEILKKFEDRLKEAGVQYKVELLRGDSSKELLVNFTAHNDVDNLVLGRRSMGKTERKLVGSTTDYCLHHAHCNVLVVTYH